MARNKDRKFKEFLVSQRSKVGPGYMNTPVWIIQKAGKRIWNRRQKRNWRQTEFGSEFKALKRDQALVKAKNTKKSGKRLKSSKINPKKRSRNTTYLKR